MTGSSDETNAFLVKATREHLFYKRRKRNSFGRRVVVVMLVSLFAIFVFAIIQHTRNNNNNDGKVTQKEDENTVESTLGAEDSEHRDGEPDEATDANENVKVAMEENEEKGDHSGGSSLPEDTLDSSKNAVQKDTNSAEGLSTPADQSIDWYFKHQEHGEKVQEELAAWRKEHSSRIIAFDAYNDHDEILDLGRILQEFKDLIATKSLILSGDATMQFMYTVIWCAIERIPVPSQECYAKQQEMQLHCKEIEGRDPHFCDNTALTPSHPELGGRLAFLPHYTLGKMHPDKLIAFRKLVSLTNDNWNIVVTMPCMEALWTPGAREEMVETSYPDWPLLFNHFYWDFLQYAPKSTFFVTTPVAICESMLGGEQDLLEWYLKGTQLTAGDPKSQEILQTYNRGSGRGDLLPNNYSGPIPVQDPQHANHAMDNSLFGNIGQQTCALMGLQRIPAADTDSSSSVRIVDLMAATEHSCHSNSTTDGRHYLGEVLLKQLTLLIKAIKSVQ